MKAYGRRKRNELEYPRFGAPSKHRRVKRVNRKRARRILHKQARNDTKQILLDLQSSGEIPSARG
jgi:hypothetical protein